MPQARIVLRDEHHELAQQIQDQTKLGTLTEVVGAMLTRYGKHMIETWVINPAQCRETPPPSTFDAPSPMAIAPTYSLVDEFPDSPPTDPGDPPDDDFI